MDEGAENDGEVGGVLAHDVVVEQQRELDAGDAAEAAEKSGDVVAWSARWEFALSIDGEPGAEFVETNADGGKDAERDAAAGHLIEKNGAGCGEEEVGAPDADEGRELAGLREGGSYEREEVIDEDEQDGEDEACGFSSAFGGDAERNADEHEDETGERIGEALVELDAVDGGVAAVGGCLGVAASPEFGERESLNGGVDATEVSVLGGFGLDGDVGGGEGGDVVLVGIGGGGVVLAAVEEMETDGLGVRGVGSSVDDDGLGRRW